MRKPSTKYKKVYPVEFIDRLKSNPISVLVSVSGGKDSQATLLWACEQYGPQNVLGVMADTGWEHPLTYAHIEKIRSLYGVEIIMINRRDYWTDGMDSVPDVVRIKRAWPTSRAKTCTGELKIKVLCTFAADVFGIQQVPFKMFQGIRKAESHARGRRYCTTLQGEEYLPHEVAKEYPVRLAKGGCRVVFPILEWTNREVLQYLQGNHNPLYDLGEGRVGCFPCLCSGDQAKINCYTFDAFGAEQYSKIKELEVFLAGRNISEGKDYRVSCFGSGVGQRWEAAGCPRLGGLGLMQQRFFSVADDCGGGNGCSFCAD